MEQKFESITCAGCGFEFWVPQSFLDRRRADGKTFYCPSSGGSDKYGVHTNYFKTKEPPKPIIKERVIEKKIDVIVEKEHEPKDFKEMLEAHTHDFSKKNSGGLSCKICGLYKAAYQELTGTI